MHDNWCKTHTNKQCPKLTFHLFAIENIQVTKCKTKPPTNRRNMFNESQVQYIINISNTQTFDHTLCYHFQSSSWKMEQYPSVNKDHKTEKAVNKLKQLVFKSIERQRFDPVCPCALYVNVFFSCLSIHFPLLHVE